MTSFVQFGSVSDRRGRAGGNRACVIGNSGELR